MPFKILTKGRAEELSNWYRQCISHKKLIGCIFSDQRGWNIGKKTGKQTLRPETKALRNLEELWQAGDYSLGEGNRFLDEGRLVCS